MHQRYFVNTASLVTALALFAVVSVDVSAQSFPTGRATPAVETVPGDARTISTPTPFGLATSLTAHDEADATAYFEFRVRVESYDFPEGTTPDHRSGIQVFLRYTNTYPDGYEGNRESTRVVSTTFSIDHPAFREIPPTADYDSNPIVYTDGGTLPRDEWVTVRVRVRDGQTFANVPFSRQFPPSIRFTPDATGVIFVDDVRFTDRDGNTINYSTGGIGDGEFDFDNDFVTSTSSSSRAFSGGVGVVASTGVAAERVQDPTNSDNFVLRLEVGEAATSTPQVLLTDRPSGYDFPDIARADDLYPTVDALAAMILATAPGSAERATAQAQYDALTGASEILASQGRITFDNAELMNVMAELAGLTAHMMSLPVTATTAERTDLQNQIDAATDRQTELQARIDADTAKVLAFRSRPTDALVTDRDSALQTIGLSIARAEFEAYSSTDEADQAIAARRADAFRREWAVIAAAEPTPTAGRTEQTFASRLSRALRRGDDYLEYDTSLDPVDEVEVGSDTVVDSDVENLTEVLLTGLNDLHARIGTQTTAIATQTASIAQLNTTTAANTASIATNTASIASNVARLSVVEQGIEEAKDGVALALALAAKPALYGKNFLLTFGTGYYDGAGAAAVSLSGNVGSKFAWGVGYSGAGSQTGAQASFKIRF